MKKCLLSLLLCFMGMVSYPQTFSVDLEATMLKNNGPLKKGETVKLVEFAHNSFYDPTKPYSEKVIEEFYISTSSGQRVDITSKIDDCFDFRFKSVQDFWDAQIITNVLYMLKSKGFQYELRTEMESDALEYINRLEEYGLIIDDPYLENYVYSLVAKIAPSILIDGRPGNINIVIQHNPSINACCFPNGTIVLNTGLLAVLHSEDELAAILAHEIAHFILDHTVQNVNKANQRQKRAEFWAALATGVTAIAEGVAVGTNSVNSYYTPGEATLNMAILASNIGNQVLNRLGMEYNHEQEEEADRLAVQVLRILGYDSNALSTALSRMEREYIVERNNARYVNSYTHPALMKRITSNGSPSSNVSIEFERMVSFAVTDVARMKYQDRRFRQCLALVSQNINNGVAQADDYILMANCILATQNTEDSNMEALNMINKAKEIGAENLNINKTEIIAMLRLKRTEEVISLLENYNKQIDYLKKEIELVKDEGLWSSYYSYILIERRWITKMLVKLRGMYEM